MSPLFNPYVVESDLPILKSAFPHFIKTVTDGMCFPTHICQFAHLYPPPPPVVQIWKLSKAENASQLEAIWQKLKSKKIILKHHWNGILSSTTVGNWWMDKAWGFCGIPETPGWYTNRMLLLNSYTWPLETFSSLGI